MRFEILKKIIIPGVALSCLCATGFADEVRHLSSTEASRMATAKPQPAYPPMAKQLHLEGKVEVEASIDETGAVSDVRPVSGNVILSNAAAQALKHWRFTPVLTDGKPGKAIATVDFLFKQ